MKYIYLIILAFPFSRSIAQARQPVLHFERSAFTKEDSICLAETYGKNKELIPEFALQTLIALSYFPELKDTRIKFIYKSQQATLSTKPVFPNLLSSGNKRIFTIIISDSSLPILKPIMLSSLEFNAQIGVIGHELSHASDFSQRSLYSLVLSGIKHISSRYIDRFEYRTDSICIAHGLGYQLLAWSMCIREEMHTENWDGADNINKPVMKQERYMNPSTIRERIKNDPMYDNIT